MSIMENYQAGVNLGGWISQYREYSHDHFKSFITKKDIEQIASWGMDHVRLPVDYPVLEDDNNPLSYKEDGFEYIDNCINWCKEFGLNIIIDIHSAPGYSFGTLDSNTLFTDDKMQNRFIKLWETIANRYISEKGNVLLELLNEVVEPDSTRWNKLAAKLVEAIRAIDKERYIIIGGNFYNAITELKNIDILNDEKIVYNFHFYEPFIFTHQKAGWTDITRLMNQEQNYPAKCAGLREFLEANSDIAQNSPQYKMVADMADVYMDKEFLKKLLKPAVDFIKATGKPLYCGEYGVIEVAPIESRINWHRDFIEFMKEYGIARACWSYKLMDFSLVDGNGKVVSDELIKIVSSK